MNIQYPVNDCYVCVQGEGVQTGLAMVLLRLHGCDVGCPWCDTKETWAFDKKNKVETLADAFGTNSLYSYVSAMALSTYISEHFAGPKWILITGGEPAQYDLKELVKALQDCGYKVALETSGTEIGHLNTGIDWVCVSPKLNMPGGKVMRSEAISSADEIKHVVGKQKDIDEFDDLLATNRLKSNVEICLQPVSSSIKATELCLDTVQSRGWRLSIQTHKFIGIK